MTTLPDKLSDLLVVALADLKTCEEDDKYRINMTKWHKPTLSGHHCEVCLAGAVMAQTLRTPLTKWQEPYLNKLGEVINMKLLAINEARIGNLCMALCLMNVTTNSVKPVTDRSVIAYKDDHDLFIKSMDEIVTYLKEREL